MSANHLDVVLQAKADLIVKGIPQDSNEFPFYMVLLTAWDTRAEGAKLGFNPHLLAVGGNQHGIAKTSHEVSSASS